VRTHGDERVPNGTAPMSGEQRRHLIAHRVQAGRFSTYWPNLTLDQGANRSLPRQFVRAQGLRVQGTNR